MKPQDTIEDEGKAARGRSGKADPANQDEVKWVDPKSLKVEPEFQQLIPLQSTGELRALEEGIKTVGCRDPLFVWKGKNIVLDGHTRRELCIKHRKPAKVKEVELPNKEAAIALILEVQRQRRNLTREAMSYLRGSEYNAAKQPHGGDRSSGKAKGQSDPLIDTADRLAEKHGVSKKTIKRDGAFAKAVDTIVMDYGDPEVKRKLLSPDVKLTQGLARLLLKKSAKERKAAVKVLVEKGEWRAGKETPAAPKPKAVAESILARLSRKGEKHAQAVLKQMAQILGFEVVEKPAGK